MNNVFGTRKSKACYVAFGLCGRMYIARYLLLVRSNAAMFFRTLDNELSKGNN